MSVEAPAESKSLLIARQAILCVLGVFAASAAAYIVLDATLPYVPETLAAIVAIAGVNTVRNIISDAPLRRATVTATYGPPPAPPAAPAASPSP